MRTLMRGLLREIAIMFLVATWSLATRADAPKPASTPRSDTAGASPKPSATSGRSKAPSGGAAPAAATAPALKSEPEGPYAEGKARAQVIFGEAVAAYKEGRYFDAIELFLETNRIYPDSKLCFNIARAFEALGNSAGALRYYREYLRRTPAAPDRTDVEASVRQLEIALSQKGLQQISVFSTPDAAILSIDGQPVALTPWTGEIWPGKHRIGLTRAGYAEAQQIVELSPLRAVDVDVELRPDAPAPATTAPTTDPRPEQGRGVEVLTVATLAAGAVLLGSALAVELSDSDSGVSGTGAFLAGAGAGATAVGGVLFYFDVAGRRSK
jgi:tetratricopeptide (TPR) repeat protein